MKPFKKIQYIVKKVLTFKFTYGILIYADVYVFFLCKFFVLKNIYSGKRYYKEVLKVRTRVTLACSNCKQRNYNTMKNKKNDPDRLEMKKYCRFCREHTLHKETK